MQNKSFLFALLLLIFSWSATVSCHAASDMSRFLGEGHKPQWEHLIAVSMIELIANPEKFDGKRVFVEGFVRFEFEGNALYFHEEDYRDNLWRNGITIGVTLEQQKQYAVCESKYCNVIGTFHAIKPGHFSLWSGHLTDITTMQYLTPLTSKPTSSRLPTRRRPIRSERPERTASNPPATVR